MRYYSCIILKEAIKYIKALTEGLFAHFTIFKPNLQYLANKYCSYILYAK